MISNRDTRLAKRDDDPPGWRGGGVPPGLPGAGWFIATFFAFAVVILSGWAGGWWDSGHSNTAAPTSHHMTNG